MNFATSRLLITEINPTVIQLRGPNVAALVLVDPLSSLIRNHCSQMSLSRSLSTPEGITKQMNTDNDDPLAQFRLDAIDLRWTLRDIKSKRTWLINSDHLPKLVELGLVKIEEDIPYLTTAGEKEAWRA
jgi:hypothetical protein